LMAAPRMILQNVGGEYKIIGLELADVGSSESFVLELLAS
jgi:hypothetical protein